MDDMISFKYPKTAYNAPTKYESHAEFLKATMLRYSIGKELQNFSIEELTWLLEFVKNGSLVQAVAVCDEDGN